MKIANKILVLTSFLGCASLTTIAQSIIPEEAITVSVEDSLIETEETKGVESFIPTADVNKVREGFQNLQRSIPLQYNSIVHSFVDYFIFKKPSFTKRMLEKKNFYFPIFEKYLAKYNMPDELKYLSMLESGLNPKAISHAKAVGLWQFMKPTGKDFGLRVDEYVDERMDIEKSTEAACKYFRQLYNIFGDWELVLASYNTGPGNLRRAIRRAGNITNYWQLHPYLHRDTRAYVPQFTAIMYMMHHAGDYGIFPEEVMEHEPVEKILIDGYLDLETFSNVSGISLDDIQKHNPSILKGVLPQHSRGFELRIPAQSYAFFEANRQMILDSAQKLNGVSVMLADASSGKSTNVASSKSSDGILIIGDPKYTTLSSTNEPIEEVEPEKEEEEIKKIRKVKKRTYTVRRGDVLNRIADKFDVDMYDLKTWNNLKSSKIMVGQRLVILDDVEEVVEVERTIKEERKSKKVIEKSKPKYHIVQRGDTLWSISQRYGGISIEKIKKINGLRSNSVKKGQKLKIV
ncbi:MULTISPECIES: lytic transglycosylase domain-containing protein [Emticicia]|uniref:lytic transglycosylase domain-containing protein n=1 Tax=Emticicia TaxID=312278 RepID=UPI0009EF0BBC|nr:MULTISPECIES: lytic transglycosylase domain-containing protein [Emticicia]